MITSIVILTYNKLEYTQICLESIREYTAKGSYELIVVDNNSTDGTVEWLKKQKDITCIFNEHNLGFPAGCNQGMKIAKGDILLLNNDTIVTPGWLTNLNTCLYSSEQIGAVGPVSNSAAYFQTIPVPYKDINGIHDFAKSYNLSNTSKWEERLKLIGFCLLIKKEVVDKVGLLDERFTPGNFEDDDYCIRMRRAGLRLMLCRDTFIHHFGSVSFRETGSFNTLLQENERKFTEKWGFSSVESMYIHSDIAALLEKNENANSSFRMLQIGCGCGGTLLYLKQNYPNACLYGIDTNGNALEEAAKVAETRLLDIKNVEPDFEGKYFDYIMIGDMLSYLKESDDILSRIRRYIKDSGQILISFSGIIDIYQLYEMARKCKSKPEQNQLKGKITEKLKSVERIFKQLANNGYENVNLVRIGYQLDAMQVQIVDYLCSMLGMELKDLFTTGNIIITANIKHQEVETMIGGNEDKLKFLLRRIENDIELEESLELVLHAVSDGQVNDNAIIDAVLADIVQKSKVFNLIGVNCFQNGLYDHVIPLLQAAYEIDNQDSATLYNIGYVLYTFGEYNLALEYLNGIKERDEEVEALLADAKEKAKIN